MLWLLLALAADPPIGPEPVGDAAAWVSYTDYPPEAVRQNAQGVVWFEVSIDEAGRAARCRILRSSGHEVLDNTACAVVMKRGRWKPTLDEAGKPIHAVLRRHVAWSLSRGPGGRRNDWRRPAADMEVAVSRLSVAPDAAKVTVRQVQTADGAQESCTVVRPSEVAALNRLACKVAEPLTKSDPIGDAAGNLVRGARWRTIQFVQQAEQ